MTPVVAFLVRIFPTVEKDWNNIILDQEHKVIYVRNSEDIKRKKQPNNSYRQFRVYSILQNISQEETYKSIFTEELKQKVLEGYDLTILAFGNSGTGKTYTISGPDKKFQYRGIIPRILECLFNSKKEEVFYKINISLKYVEIIEKSIYNLLERGKPKYDKHVEPVNVSSFCEALKFVLKGNSQRKFENLNTHCGTAVLSIIVTRTPCSFSSPVTIKSKIHIVDTAGTEFGGNASKSLRCHNDANLVMCHLNTIRSWAEWDLTEKTPNWRSSMLAYYLGSSLRNGYIRLLGHVKPTGEAIPGTMSTMIFGTRFMKLPSPQLIRTKVTDQSVQIKQLQEELFELKGKTAIEEAIYGIYKPNSLSQNQMKHALQLVKAFLNSELADICILEIAHPLVTIQIFKDIYNATLNEMQILKDELNSLKNEHDLSQKTPETDLRVRSSRKRNSSSSTSIRSKKDKPKDKKSVYVKTSDNSDTNLEMLNRTEDERPSRQSRGTYDLSSTPLEDEEAGEGNYQKTFAEFLATSVQWKMRIYFHKQNVDENFKIKKEMANEMADIRYKLKNLRITLEDEKWKEEMNPSEPKYDRNGKLLTKSPLEEKLEAEIKDLETKFFEARNRAISAHQIYIAASKALNEEMLLAQAGHNEYTRNLYSTSLILPPLEVFEGVLTNDEIQEESNEIKKCYETLQKKN